MESVVRVPDLLYVFVNETNLMAAMNLEVAGRFSSSVVAALRDPEFAAAYSEGSADFLPFVPNPGLSSGFISAYGATAINGYRVEYDAELARRAHFKSAPSRLTGVYAFESYADCQRVSQKYGWRLESVRRFRQEVVLRAVRVNMEIVSLARLAYARAALDESSIDWLWRCYWGGSPSIDIELPSVDGKSRERLTSGVIWEWIIDGVLVIEGQDETGSQHLRSEVV